MEEVSEELQNRRVSQSQEKACFSAHIGNHALVFQEICNLRKFVPEPDVKHCVINFDPIAASDLVVVEDVIIQELYLTVFVFY